MKSVTMNSPLRRPGPREGVGLRCRRQSGVESRVEHRYLRDRGQDSSNSANALQAGRVMQRGQFAQFTDGAWTSGVIRTAVVNRLPP